MFRVCQRLPIALLIALGACGKPAATRQLDPALIRVTTDAKMRTDVVGDGQFAETSTFVLVDAENTADEGAYVTLAGTLADPAGAVVGDLKPASLWVPAHASRTFALIDSARKPRPTAVGAQVAVRGAVIPEYAPVARLTDIKTIDDTDKVVVQARLENPSDRAGRIIVIASFHDAAGRPMTRPFDLLNLDAKRGTNLQFVGPKGSKTGAIYIGDESY